MHTPMTLREALFILREVEPQSHPLYNRFRNPQDSRFYHYFDPKDGGRVWLDGVFTYEQIEALMVLGRAQLPQLVAGQEWWRRNEQGIIPEFFYGSSDGTIPPMTIVQAEAILQKKRIGRLHPARIVENSDSPYFSSRPYFDAAHDWRLEITGETLLAELEAILVLCEDQVQWKGQ